MVWVFPSTTLIAGYAFFSDGDAASSYVTDYYGFPPDERGNSMDSPFHPDARPVYMGECQFQVDRVWLPEESRIVAAALYEEFPIRVENPAYAVADDTHKDLWLEACALKPNRRFTLPFVSEEIVVRQEDMFGKPIVDSVVTLPRRPADPRKTAPERKPPMGE
jgi:hypothetical protein